MKGDGLRLLEDAWKIVEKGLGDPVFWAEQIPPGLFFLVLGGLFGSFLNVVAYRVPRGRSVMGRRSHCPACGAMIRGRDNVPVFGWLMLGGRCYRCRGWISARYPVVEAIMAGGVMLLAVRELATNGANMPGGSPGWPDGPDLVFVHASWRVMAAFIWHVALLATLVVWALFAIDGHQPSGRGIGGVVACLAAVGLVLPGEIPIDVAGNAGWSDGLAAVRAVSEAAVVAAVGGLLGGLAGAIPAYAVAPRDGGWMWWGGGVAVGVTLGWQAAVAASLIGFGLAAAWCGLCLLAGGWRDGRADWFRFASLSLPIAAVGTIGWWQSLLWAASSWFAHSILIASAGTLSVGL